MDLYRQAAAGVGVGAGPDGLGATLVTQQYGPMQVLPQQATQTYYPVHGPIDFIEPKDTSTSAAVQSAGVAAVLAAVGGGLGLAMGGPFGAVGGVLIAGSLSNGYRAQKWINDADPGKKHEAVVSGVFCLVDLVAGGYCIYRATQRGRK